MRVDQFLNEQGYGSRKAIKRMLAQKRVQVDGQPILQGSFQLEPFIQCVMIDGQKYEQKLHDYLMLNKPAGVVSAVSDRQHPTVVDGIQPSDYTRPLFPVGRLDRDTTGLVLLTNNGAFAYQLMHPSYHVVKKYEVTVNGRLTERDIRWFREGIEFADGTQCRPAKLTIFFASAQESRAMVEISEGKFHQVKKMFLCVGCKVLSLKRISIGSLTLDEHLAPGQYRALQKDELKKLWSPFL